MADCKFGQTGMRMTSRKHTLSSFAPHPPGAEITLASAPSGHKMTAIALRSLADGRKHRINASPECLSLRSSPANLGHVSELCHLPISKIITFQELEMNLIDVSQCAPEQGKRLPSLRRVTPEDT